MITLVSSKTERSLDFKPSLPKRPLNKAKKSRSRMTITHAPK